MIHIGLRRADKSCIIDEYMRTHGCRKVFVLSPDEFALPSTPLRVDNPETECDGRSGIFIPYNRVQYYRWYYKLLAEIDNTSLVVVNECHRSQKRTGDLDTNCIHNFLNQTPHILVFQWLPFIESMNDFMTLFDFATRSKSKREAYRPELLRLTRIAVHNGPPEIVRVDVHVDNKTCATYAKERARLFAEVRDDVDKDPDIIPRNLLLVSGKAKVAHVDPARQYVGRNNRFKLPNVVMYKNIVSHEPHAILEMPHNHIDLCDMLATTEQSHVDVLVADTKADDWYWQRCTSWLDRLRDGYAALHGRDGT